MFPVKIVDDDFSIADSAIIAGFSIRSGFKQGSEPAIRIINASFGKYDRSKSVELFINAMKNFGKGTLVIAAAGNEDTMKRSLPAAYANVVAVSNVKYEKNARKPLVRILVCGLILQPQAEKLINHTWGSLQGYWWNFYGCPCGCRSCWSCSRGRA